MLVSLVLVPIWEAGAGLLKMHNIIIITTIMRKMLVSLVLVPTWEVGVGLVKMHIIIIITTIMRKIFVSRAYLGCGCVISSSSQSPIS